MTRLPIAVLPIIVAALIADSARADEPPVPITVRTHGGRSYTGFVDRETSPTHLSLRIERGRAALWYPIPWSQIEGAMHEGRDIRTDELRELAARIQSSRHVVLQPRHRPAKREAPPPAPPSPAAIAIDAQLANWDADVESDGILLWLKVNDDAGNTTAARGTLEVELLAPLARKYHEVPQGRGYSVELIERWNVNVTEAQFRSGEVRIRLPFGTLHPQFDSGIDLLGLVHARLAVSGHGVFEQSLDGIPLRPFAPTRDALLDNEGRYFLPTEGTGRGKTAF